MSHVDRPYDNMYVMVCEYTAVVDGKLRTYAAQARVAYRDFVEHLELMKQGVAESRDRLVRDFGQDPDALEFSERWYLGTANAITGQIEVGSLKPWNGLAR